MKLTEADLIQKRLDSVVKFDRIWMDSLKKDIEYERNQFLYLARAVLTGSELTILGKPVHIELSWPEGPPYGLTNEQIADIAAPQP